MYYNQIFVILLIAILFSLGTIAWTLRRILRIMIMQNKGLPGLSDLANLSLDNMAAKKKDNKQQWPV